MRTINFYLSQIDSYVYVLSRPLRSLTDSNIYDKTTHKQPIATLPFNPVSGKWRLPVRLYDKGPRV